MDNKRFLIVLAVIVAVFIGIVIYSNKVSDAEDSAKISSNGSQNFYGKKDSSVTLTEFVDFQCEACYAYYPHVKEVKEKYKDRVNFQVRNFPITSGHQFALIAAKSAEAAARQGKFWEMHDMIFENQKVWERTSNPQEAFDKYAKTIGLDMDKYNKDKESPDVAAVIQKDLADVEELGGTGTPTFALNGKKVEPDASVEEISKLLDDALAEAEAEAEAEKR